MIGSSIALFVALYLTFVLGMRVYEAARDRGGDCTFYALLASASWALFYYLSHKAS